MRIARLFILLAIVLAGIPATARALSVAPSGAYTASSLANVSIRLTSNGQNITCDAAQLPFALASDGTGSASAGASIYNRCTNPVIGTWIVTQSSAWTASVTLTAGPKVAIVFTVPRGGLRVDAGCPLNLSGTITFTHDYSGRSLPLTVTPSDSFVQTSALTIDATVCSPIYARVGLEVSIAGTYGLSRSFTVSG